MDDELFWDNATDAGSEATTSAPPSQRARRAPSGSMPSTPLTTASGGDDKTATTCLLPECAEPIKPKSRWCPLHDRYAANLTYSASKYEDEGHPNFKAEYKKKMKSDEFAIAEVREEEQRNPTSLNLEKAETEAELGSEARNLGEEDRHRG